jgi:hypothetical protein
MASAGETASGREAALNHAVFKQDAFGGGRSGINPYGNGHARS